MISLVSVLFGAAEAALELFAEREKNYAQKRSSAFAQKLRRIKTDYYKELNRPLERRSDAVLDALMLEMKLLVEEFSAVVRADLGEK